MKYKYICHATQWWGEEIKHAEFTDANAVRKWAWWHIQNGWRVTVERVRV